MKIFHLNPFRKRVKQEVPPNAKIEGSYTTGDEHGNLETTTTYFKNPSNKYKEVKNTYFERKLTLSGRKWTVVKTKHPKLSFVYRFFKRAIGSRFIAGDSSKRMIIASIFQSNPEKNSQSKIYRQYDLSMEYNSEINNYIDKINEIKAGLGSTKSCANYHRTLNRWL